MSKEIFVAFATQKGGIGKSPDFVIASPKNPHQIV